MFSFFRSYQKIFFYFVAAVMIASCFLYGIFSGVSEERSKPDPIVSHTVDRGAVKRSEVKNLSRFLQTSQEDLLHQDAIYPNLCNEGVIRRDFIQTGLASLLVKTYFDPLKKDLQYRLDKAQKFRPYAHPKVPLFSLESLWQQVSPELFETWKEIRSQSEVSVHFFDQMLSLYERQVKMPPETIRHLFISQIQSQNLPWDARLPSADFSFFGFHSVADWFGSSFIDMISQFILNGAAMAEQKGYQVTLSEAKGDLLFHFETAKAKLPQETASLFSSFSEHLHHLGFSEKEAVEVWRKVLLFRRYFQTASHAMFVDLLSAKHLAEFAQETALVTEYQWPSSCILKTEEDVIAFEIYLAMVGQPRDNILDLPPVLLSEQEIIEKSPELFQATLKADYSSISLAEVALKVSLREVLEWELGEENWESLSSQFPFLGFALSREDRVIILERLTADLREQVDQYVKLEIVKLHPEWIDDALSKANPQSVVFLSKAPPSFMINEKDGLEVVSLANKVCENDVVAREKLLKYPSSDGRVVYRIDHIEQIQAPHILTFQEIREGNFLKILEDQFLKKYYQKVRAEFPSKFQDAQGKWRPFSEVKSQVAKIFLSPLFNVLKASPLYGLLRTEKIMEIAQGALRKNQNDPRWVQKGGSPLLDQFKLLSEKRKIQRGFQLQQQEEWMKITAFTLYPNEWSAIHVSPTGDASFFYLEDRHLIDVAVLDQAPLDQREPEVLGALGSDAWCCLAERLLRTIEEMDAMSFTLDEQ